MATRVKQLGKSGEENHKESQGSIHERGKDADGWKKPLCVTTGRFDSDLYSLMGLKRKIGSKRV